MSKLPTQKFYRNEYTDVDVEIISCTGPSNFYVHLKTRLGDLKRFQERVDGLCIGISWKLHFYMNKLAVFLDANLVKITVIAIGLDCVTKYTIDGKWYRPTVSDVKGGRVEVQFID